MPITQAEYARRRADLMAQMGSNSIAVIPAAKETIRSRDTDYAYRQSSDVLYLSGFPEPEALLVLIPGRSEGEFVVFCRQRDREREIWDGYREGPEGARANYAAAQAFTTGEVDEVLPGLLEGKDRVYYAVGRDADFDRQMMGWLNRIRAKARTGAVPPGEFVDLDKLLHARRLFKSEAELEVMARAGQIAAQAHCRAMSACRPGLFEYQLEAEILHEFAFNGARFPAYNTIVGGGANACVLHYISNAARLNDGDLVLIDAGCEYQDYAADITRTFPVNGRFSPEQKALYEIVLAAQYAAIAEVGPGRHWNSPHEAAVRVISEGLLQLGLVQGSVEEVIESGSYREFFMHRTGHWLGMDVHDVGDYKVGGTWRPLEPGMVLTVEPGIYVSPDNTKVAEKWRGIGIRIEDDVAVTASGCRVLTDGVPKTVAEIEQLMAERGGRG